MDTNKRPAKKRRFIKKKKEAPQQFLQNSFSGEMNKEIIVSIDFGTGQVERISVHPNDNPQLIAHNFCRQHNLSPELVEPLTNEIVQNILRFYDQASTKQPSSQPSQKQSP